MASNNRAQLKKVYLFNSTNFKESITKLGDAKDSKRGKSKKFEPIMA